MALEFAPLAELLRLFGVVDEGDTVLVFGSFPAHTVERVTSSPLHPVDGHTKET